MSNRIELGGDTYVSVQSGVVTLEAYRDGCTGKAIALSPEVARELYEYLRVLFEEAPCESGLDDSAVARRLYARLEALGDWGGFPHTVKEAT